jgi:hypothetical protein
MFAYGGTSLAYVVVPSMARERRLDDPERARSCDG